MKPFSLYLHMPFCHHKCPYCDFNTYAVAHVPEGAYTSALLSELDYRASTPEWKGRTVQTIYFGGGTPSLFSAKAIRKILSVISQTFPVAENLEISLEANPGTVNTDSLMGYRESGVNRISFGIQSFNPTLLKNLGRIHTADQGDAAIETALVSGFSNISLDLMYGIPEQTIQDLRQDLDHALSLSIAHMSVYGLTIEEGTPYYQSLRRGTLNLPSEDDTSTMMDAVNSVLPEHGFNRYEISNYSRPGREAKHNLAYWNGDDYLGLGAGAHSFHSYGAPVEGIYGRRWSNYALPKKYMECTVTYGSAESWTEKLDRGNSMFEYFFLGLRKTRGVSLHEFERRFGVTIEEQYPELTQILLGENLIFFDGDYMSLTDRGLLLSDSVIENFAATYSALPEKKTSTVAPRESFLP